MSQALYRKWRPGNWDQVVGQQHVVQTLRNAVTSGRIAHAYLFAGPRGTGKTSAARLLAKAVNCLAPDMGLRPCGECEHCRSFSEGRFLDLIEIDAASNTSVEDVRDLREKINFSPNLGRYKVYIIDEVHMLSTAAFNALLKTLEEPPSHAIFILATTEVHKIPATVLSRCQRHEFRRIPVVEIVAHLRQMAEGEQILIEEAALTLVARQSTGAMRDAISLLDQLASSGQKITLEMAREVLGTAASQAVLDILEALIAGDASTGLDCIHQALDAGSDPRQFARQVVDYLRDILLIQMGNADQIDAPADVRAQMARHSKAFTTAELLRVIRLFNQAGNDTRGAWQPALPLEMAFVEALETPPAADPPPAVQAAQTAPTRHAAQRLSPPAASRGGESGEGRTPEADSPSPQSEETLETKAEDGDLAKTLAEAWPPILSYVREINPQAYGLLNSCKSRFVKGNLLVLGFASDVLKFKMEKEENLEAVHQALLKCVQRDLMVRCTTSTGKRNTIPPEVDNEGMIAAALRDLGGEIVDIQ